MEPKKPPKFGLNDDVVDKRVPSDQDTCNDLFIITAIFWNYRTNAYYYLVDELNCEFPNSFGTTIKSLIDQTPRRSVKILEYRANADGNKQFGIWHENNLKPREESLKMIENKIKKEIWRNH